MIVLVIGGARSGKSAYAERLARHLGDGEAQACCYLATGEAFDDEMRDRIAKHQLARGDSFFTVEEPVELANACRKLPQGTKSVLLDCMTTWLGNISYRRELDAERTEKSCALEDSSAVVSWLEYLPQSHHHTVMVSNELGMGLVPADRASREFRDAQGRLNQRVAALADLVVFMVAGLPMVLKGQLPDEHL